MSECPSNNELLKFIEFKKRSEFSKREKWYFQYTSGPECGPFITQEAALEHLKHHITEGTWS